MIDIINLINSLMRLDFPSVSNLIKGYLIRLILQQYASLGNYDNLQGIPFSAGSVNGQLAETPAEWNNVIYSQITSVTQNSLMMIAGVIVAFVLTYDLIQMVMDKNNLHDVDINVIVKWTIKAMITVTLVANAPAIVSGVFDLSSWLIEKAQSFLGNSSYTLFSDIEALVENVLLEKSILELCMIMMGLGLVSLSRIIIVIIAFVLIWSRMIEIYMVIAASPVPFATLMCREWSDVGKNYIKLICAYGLQAYLIMIVFAVYSALVKNIAYSGSATSTIILCISYTCLFGYMLFKTERLAKSIFYAH